jgi:hypothetical protein
MKSMDRLFGISNLDRVWQGESFDRIDEYLPGARHIDRADPFDPGAKAYAPTDEEVARLRTELLDAGRIGGRADSYVKHVVRELDSRALKVILTKEEEQVLFATLERSAQNHSGQLGGVVSMLLHKPRNRKKVEDLLLLGLSPDKDDYQERAELLGKEWFDTKNVNAALGKVANDKNMPSVARTAAMNALGDHQRGAKEIKAANLEDNNRKIRDAAAENYEVKPNDADVIRNLSPNNQYDAVVRAKLSGQAFRKLGTNADAMVKNAFSEESWANYAAGMEYFIGRVESPIMSMEQPPSDINNSLQIKYFDYGKTMNMQQKTEPGYQQIESPATAANFLENAVDSGLPKFLLELGVKDGELNTIMKEFRSLNILGIASGAKLSGFDVLGQFVKGKNGAPNNIWLDIDAIERDAKRTSLHPRYLEYDVTLHEMFHNISNSALANNKNAMHEYLIAPLNPLNPPIPLDEPLTEFFTTAYELYATEAKRDKKMDAHAGEIGLTMKDILGRMNNSYTEVTHSANFINWMQQMGLETVFHYYIRGDVEGLRKATSEKLGMGVFESVFPQK